jgi:hypothetical protein
MRWFLYTIMLLIPIDSYGEDSIPKNWAVNGYLTDMASFIYQRLNDNWTFDNLIHNRLNFNWHNSPNSLNATLELRNRIIMGESVKANPYYPVLIEHDNGFVQLSKNVATGTSYVFNVRIDRAYIDYIKNKFQLRIGRQRINWGQCYTWNPNDLFNVYSFYDFDYVEKPGCDAFRLQYFTSSTSTLEMAVKLDNNHKITSAALYRFNKWNYDIQFMGGLFNEEDYVIGAGWSGNVKGASFRGEFSYFHPKKNFGDTTGILVASIGSEYSFRNSSSIQFEILYNQNKSLGIKNFADYYNMTLSAKNLSFSEISLMLQGSYLITPLFNFTLAFLYFPNPYGTFISPSFTYSLTNNMDISLIIQSFTGQLEKGHNESFNFGFLRLKWNF